MLTLFALAIVVFLVGTEHILFIAIAAALIYLYPVHAILFLTFIGALKWYGEAIKRKIINYFKKRKPK
jgi:hypothetical protein